MRDSYDVCAIGGGPDALVAAAYLASAGHSVLAVGEAGRPGGVAANVEIAPGFQFPVFPETLPSLDPAVAGDLELGRHGLELVAPDPVLTVWGRDGGSFALPRDPEHARLAVAGLSASDAARFPGFVAEVGAFAGFLRKLLEQPPLQLDSTLPDAIPAAFAALGLGPKRVNGLLRTLPMALADFLDDWFESEPLKAALAGPILTGTRLGPRAPGTAGLFLHFHAFGNAGAARLDPSGPRRLGGGRPGAAGGGAGRRGPLRVRVRRRAPDRERSGGRHRSGAGRRPGSAVRHGRLRRRPGNHPPRLGRGAEPGAGLRPRRLTDPLPGNGGARRPRAVRASRPRGHERRPRRTIRGWAGSCRSEPGWTIWSGRPTP